MRCDRVAIVATIANLVCCRRRSQTLFAIELFGTPNRKRRLSAICDRLRLLPDYKGNLEGARPGVWRVPFRTMPAERRLNTPRADRPQRVSSSPLAPANRPSSPAVAAAAHPDGRRRLQNPADLSHASPWHTERGDEPDSPLAEPPLRRASPRLLSPAAAAPASPVPLQSSSRASSNANWNVDGGMFYCLLAQLMLRDVPPSVSTRNW